MDFLIAWLIPLSSSPVRQLRQTATTVAMQLQHALIDVASDCKGKFSTLQRQLDAEKGKKKPRKNKIVSYEASCKMTNEHVQLLEKAMEELFTGVFVHRYRDCYEMLRVDCMRSLGDWISEYPAKFLHDKYLKYIGWQLYDKDGSVRLAATMAVLKLYNNEDHAAQLQLFTERFKERMLQLCFDTEEVVTIAGIQLATSLLRMEALDEEEVEPIRKLVWDANPKVRNAASEFGLLAVGDGEGDDLRTLRLMLAVDPDDEDDEDDEDGEGSGPSDLAEACMVDSMWGKLPALKNWEVMSSELLTDDSDGDAAQQLKWARLLLASVAKACGSSPLTKEPVKLSKRLQEDVEEDCKALTLSLMTVLPKLLSKFQAEPEILLQLVQLPRFMDVEQ